VTPPDSEEPAKPPGKAQQGGGDISMADNNTKQLTNNELVALSTIAQRAGMSAALGQQFGGERDLYSALGYKKELQYDDYYAIYDRQDIAGRIVNMPASATWRNVPEVKEDDDEEEQTPFEAAWTSLARRLKIWHYLERVDRLAGIGHYAVLVIGVRGGSILNEPLEPNTLRVPEDIIYLSPFAENSATIHKWVTDPGDPRFGKPAAYMVDFAGDFKGLTGFGQGAQEVHHTRVLHVADELLEDEVYGRPRLKRVINCFYDLAKVAGGSAEMFWQGAFRGLHANLKEGAEMDPQGPEAQKISDELDEYIHGLRRYIRTQGMDLKTLGGETPDPRGIFDVLISLIAGATGIPKRILLGSERGELASSQDESNFNAYVSERQLHFAEPLVLRPLIDKLIYCGALPPPADEYEIVWPNLFALDENEKAEIADKKASTIQKYVTNPMAEEVMPIPEFRREVLGLEGEPSEEDLEYLEQRMADDLEGDDTVDEEFAARVRNGGPVEEEEEEEEV